MPNPIMRYFEYEHLKPGPHKDISAELCLVAKEMDRLVPDGPEKSAGLRKLLEAKDCLIRASLPDSL